VLVGSLAKAVQVVLVVEPAVDNLNTLDLV